MLKPVILAVAIALMPGLSLAETRDDRLAAARSYLEMTMADLDVDRMIRQMYQPLLQQLAARGTTATAPQIAELDALYMSNLKQPLLDVMQAQDEIMADLMTLEEIQAIAAFYATPAGRAVMRKLPEMMERQQPQIMTLMQQTMPRVMPEVARIFNLK